MRMPSRVKNLVALSISALSVVILAVFLIDPNLISRRTPGSFEYVRKGTELLDKGRHLDAIRYFEKGYESSPGSDVIRDNLVYAYSEYAEKAAEDEKYGAGIEYLVKAYNTVRNSYTIQNLALMYAKRALHEAKDKNWKAVEEDLEAACQTAADSNNAKRNLGISLFNDAVGEFKSGRDDSAILLLKAAVLVYPDSKIYEFMGDVYYKKNDLEIARFYLDKAAKIDPTNNEVSEKREKVIASEKLAKAEETRSLPYFDIKYGEGLVAVTLSLAAKILEAAYYNVGKDLSYFPKAKTVVFFYSENDFRRIFKMPSQIRAFYDGNIRIPFPESLSDEAETTSYLYHEYAHAILSAKTNNNCPVWLSEGIAVYEELKWTRPGAAISLSGRIDEASDISIASLEAVFKTGPRDNPRLAITYLTAYTAVEYMVDNWGMKGLDAVLKRLAGGQHIVNAIDDEFLLSEKEFQARWKDFVEQKYLKKREVE